MRIKCGLFLLMMFCAFFMIRCDRDFSIKPIDSTIRELTSLEKQLIESDHHFGLKLFREVARTESNKNVFISPLSVAMALGMTFNGAAGETEEAMRNTLEFEEFSNQEINESFRSLISLLIQLDPRVIFEIANSIWYRNTFQVEQEFININKTYFNAEVNALDFSSPTAPDVINGWVDQKTHGKIKEIIDQIDPLVVMVLINAIYFKGTWTYEFDPDQTQDDWFTTYNGTQVDCRMMRQENTFEYLETDDFQAVDLPYGNGQFSMTVFLPEPGTAVNDWIAQITLEDWRAWIGQFSTTRGTLYFPKFILEYKINLNQVLTNLGMGIAFDPNRADFTKINPRGDLFISGVLHKTFVEVDEQGTEAAAVTAVEVGTTSIDGPPTGFCMRVDRPFLFVIREHHSGTILFIGKVEVL
jgi:serine protease inhibitor